jgi:predicted metal-dependent peptidase
LPQLALQQRAQEVYHATLNPYEGRWHSVAPMAELLREAIAEVDDSTRIKDAELIIRGVPITEIDFSLHNDVQRLYIVGFDNHVVGTWALLSPKRMIVAAVVIVGALSLLIGLFMLIF